MLGLAAVILSVAALDSVNPSTVGPALVLAAVEPHSGRRVAAFTVGVFTVSTVGGIVLLVGPGRAQMTLCTFLNRTHTASTSRCVSRSFGYVPTKMW